MDAEFEGGEGEVVSLLLVSTYSCKRERVDK